MDDSADAVHSRDSKTSPLCLPGNKRRMRTWKLRIHAAVVMRYTTRCLSLALNFYCRRGIWELAFLHLPREQWWSMPRRETCPRSAMPCWLIFREAAENGETIETTGNKRRGYSVLYVRVASWQRSRDYRDVGVLLRLLLKGGHRL